ncbi:hypothetical protein NST38_30600 [Paenibacillus sp. FSL H8-0104]|uniref:hypothetical protein n=1 Tax=Paenibacillus sp. FSL H8-0104 TaxID=2954509 RepID=UPI0030FDAD39
MKYSPMTDIVKKFSNNHRFSYHVVASISARKGDHEDYINRNIRISSNEILSKDELAERAALVASGLIDSQSEFKLCDHVQIVGIAFAGAYDRDLK